MSRYKRGDVVRAHFAYFDTKENRFVSKPRPFVVVYVEDETENVTVACTTQTHQSEKYPGVLVDCKSKDGVDMGIDQTSFIYCNETITFQNKDIIRRIGNCPLIDEIEKLLSNI